MRVHRSVSWGAGEHKCVDVHVCGTGGAGGVQGRYVNQCRERAALNRLGGGGGGLWRWYQEPETVCGE